MAEHVGLRGDFDGARLRCLPYAASEGDLVGLIVFRYQSTVNIRTLILA